MDVKPYLCHMMDFNPDNIIFTREGESKFTLLSHKYKGKEIPILLNFRTKSLGVDKIDTKKSNCKINLMQIPNCKFKGIDEKIKDFCQKNEISNGKRYLSVLYKDKYMSPKVWLDTNNKVYLFDKDGNQMYHNQTLDVIKRDVEFDVILELSSIWSMDDAKMFGVASRVRQIKLA